MIVINFKLSSTVQRVESSSLRTISKLLELSLDNHNVAGNIYYNGSLFAFRTCSILGVFVQK